MMLYEMRTLINVRKLFLGLLHRGELKIPTHLTNAEKFELYHLAKKCRGAVCVEIGSYLGASSCFIAAGLKKSARTATLFCIDTWRNNSMSEGKRDTFQEFMNNILPYQESIVPLRGYSAEVLSNAGEHFQQIDFLFIDGDHSYEGCREDWTLCRPFLVKGSLVIFHDIGWAEGVQRVVKEEVAPSAVKEGRLPNLYWAWLK
jgi:predicted O-methyltransferase YrrM